MRQWNNILLRWLGVVALSAVFYVGCGGGASGIHTLDMSQVGQDAGFDASMDLAGYDYNSEALGGKCTSKREIIILEDTSKPVSLSQGQSHMIAAKVVDFKGEDAGAQVLVFFEVTKVTDLDGNPVQGDGDAKLQSGAAYTDDTGVVRVVFAAGTQTGLVYTVQLTTKCAKPQTIQFAVVKAPVGSVKVAFKYDSGPPLNEIKVSLLPGDFTCEQLAPEKPLSMVLADKTVFSTHSSAQFDTLTAGTRYTLFAVAKGPMHMIAASGCRDGILTLPDQVTHVTLPLYMVVLNPTGKYDCTDHFDFTNVIKDCSGGITDPLECATSAGADVGKQVCCALYQLVTFFNDPGKKIIDLIEDIAKQYIGSLIVNAFDLFSNAVSDIITNWLLHDSPKWMQNFLKVGQDMMGVITNLEMYSTLELSKIQNNLTIQGKHYWTGIALYWKIGCNPKDPHYDTCGKHVFSMKDLKNTQFPLDLVGGQFVASVFDFNKMQIHQHNIDFSYGKLVLFVLDEIILPGVTGGKAHSLQDVLALWLDCKGISNGILGKISKWFTGSSHDIEKVCNAAVSSLGGFVGSFLGALQIDTDMSLRGQCTLVDENDDLRVDKLTKGTYYGEIETGKGKSSAFTGKFEATKQK